MQSEYFTPRAIRCGLNRGFMQIVDDTLEKKCSLCGEFFPCDLEFFHSDGKNGMLKSKCKPCWDETKHHSQYNGTSRVGRPRNKDKRVINFY